MKTVIFCFWHGVFEHQELSGGSRYYTQPLLADLLFPLYINCSIANLSIGRIQEIDTLARFENKEFFV